MTVPWNDSVWVYLPASVKRCAVATGPELKRLYAKRDKGALLAEGLRSSSAAGRLGGGALRSTLRLLGERAGTRMVEGGSNDGGMGRIDNFLGGGQFFCWRMLGGGGVR